MTLLIIFIAKSLKIAAFSTNLLLCSYLWEYPCNLPQSATTPRVRTLGQELANHKSLERHMVIQHPTQDATDLVCEICAYSTPSKDKLRAHKFAKHEVEKHKQCPLCDFKSPTKVWILYQLISSETLSGDYFQVSEYVVEQLE